MVSYFERMKDMYQPGYRSPFSSYYNYLNGGETEGCRVYKKLKVFGEGSVSVKPDIAQISIGVTTEDKQLETAQQENARITQQVIDVIKSMGVTSKDIQTQVYDIQPQYDYIEGRQVFRGYRVINILKVVVRDLEKVGVIIDAAVKAGANTVNNISFTVSDQRRYYEQALRLAIEDAQKKAFAVGDKLKVRINPVPVNITEQSVNVGIPFSPMVLKASTEAATPIEAGENEIMARIEAIFIYTE